MDDLPTELSGYSGPDPDSGKGSHEVGTYRFFLIAFAVLVGIFLVWGLVAHWLSGSSR